jgi:hypothetical protein
MPAAGKFAIYPVPERQAAHVCATKTFKQKKISVVLSHF